ncbi:MAG: c-type heme family protein [Salibacteraceae bacterium]
MRKVIVALFLSVLLISCTDEVVNSPKNHAINSDSNALYEQMAKGFQVMESTCISCHDHNPVPENKVAPSFSEVKRAYINKAADFDSFKKILTDFVKNPGSSNAIMKEAVDNYGVMPKFDISEEEANNLAVYLFNSPLENEGWYEVFYSLDKENFGNRKQELSYLELGKKNALSTKAVLGKNLKGTIKNKGTKAAVSFCNSKAYPLTDSMSIELNAHIKRVSDQPRNPNNQANYTELEYIKEAKQILAIGEKIKPQMQEMEGKMVGYYPITTNGMCLQCHGQPNTQIKPEVLQNIKDLYPNDLATGYGENELRGIWVVTMDVAN